MNCLKRNAPLTMRRALMGMKYSSVASQSSVRTTIDTNEIDLHAELKSQWWSDKGTMKALHALNKLR